MRGLATVELVPDDAVGSTAMRETSAHVVRHWAKHRVLDARLDWACLVSFGFTFVWRRDATQLGLGLRVIDAETSFWSIALCAVE